MKRVLLHVAALVVCLSPAVSRAATSPMTGFEFLQECQLATQDGSKLKGFDLFMAAHCNGYLTGVRDSLAVWTATNDLYKKGLPPPACIPDNVTPFELAKVVVKYLNDNPTKLHENFNMIPFYAFEEAYPCKQ